MIRRGRKTKEDRASKATQTEAGRGCRGEKEGGVTGGAKERGRKAEEGEDI